MKIDIYNYPPEGTSPLDLARFQVAVMEAAERGEPVEVFDTLFPHQGWCLTAGALFNDWGSLRYRIARLKVAKGHNPTKLTEEQVGVEDGWRLLAPEELGGVLRHPDHGRSLSLYYDDSGDWDDSDDPCSAIPAEWTYRTKKPVGYFLPKTQTPWTFQTAPKGCVLLRPNVNDSIVHLVTSWDQTGVSIALPGFLSYSSLASKWTHSLDGGKSWLPCTTNA
jgi:hypothetical protein